MNYGSRALEGFDVGRELMAHVHIHGHPQGATTRIVDDLMRNQGGLRVLVGCTWYALCLAVLPAAV